MLMLYVIGCSFPSYIGLKKDIRKSFPGMFSSDIFDRTLPGAPNSYLFRKFYQDTVSLENTDSVSIIFSLTHLPRIEIPKKYLFNEDFTYLAECEDSFFINSVFLDRIKNKEIRSMLENYYKYIYNQKIQQEWLDSQVYMLKKTCELNGWPLLVLDAHGYSKESHTNGVYRKFKKYTTDDTHLTEEGHQYVYEHLKEVCEKNSIQL